MKRLILLLFGLFFFGVVLAPKWMAPPLRGESLWERRDPRVTHLFQDTRARKVGDSLTIIISEATILQTIENRFLVKDTIDQLIWDLTTNYQAGAKKRSFTGDFNSNLQGNRQLQGRSLLIGRRTFDDKLSVVVTAVMPNGNLVVEGYRKRNYTDENRTLKVSGIVRPIDINVLNQIEGQFVANLTFNYIGKGAESAYENNGWLGRIFNWIWPP